MAANTEVLSGSEVLDLEYDSDVSDITPGEVMQCIIIKWLLDSADKNY